MSDEIDIENHELIDNPEVRNVFPNLKVIKQEILDYGIVVPRSPDGPLEVPQDDVFIHQVRGTLVPKPPEVVVKKERVRIQDQMVFLDDIKPTLPLFDIPDEDEHEQTIYQNKIIVGKKKAKNPPKIKQCKVVLDETIDFCETCNILFVSKNEFNKHVFDNHKGNKMNRLIVGNKRAYDRNSVSFQNDVDKFRSNSAKGDQSNSCFHCDKIFESKQFVVDHLYEVLNNKNVNKKSGIRLKSNQKNAQINTHKKDNTKKRNELIKDTKSGTKAFMKNGKPKVGPKSKVNLNKVHSAPKYNTKSISVVVTRLSEDVMKAYLDKYKNPEKTKNQYENMLRDDNDDGNSDVDSKSKPSDEGENEDFSCGSDNEYAPADLESTTDEEETTTNIETNNPITNHQLYERSNLTRLKDRLSFFRCFICTSYLPIKDKGLTRSHMRTYHRIRSSKALATSAFNPYCSFCDFKCKDVSEYNEHVIKNKLTHRNKTYDLDDFQFYVYKCLICDEEFSSTSFLYKHKNFKHANVDRGFSAAFLSDKAYFEKVKAKDHPKMFAGVTGYGDLVNPPVPRGVLFKCTSCSSHFCNVRAAKIHHTKCLKYSKDNLNLANNYKCNECDLFINKNIRKMHIKQHETCNEFKVYDVGENNNTLLEKILCLCPKCGVHYTETLFWKHYDKCRDNVPESKYCLQCDILVDSTSKYLTHEERHKTVDEFIIIEFIENDQDTEMKRKQDETEFCVDAEMIDSEKTQKSNKILGKNHLILFYCKYCKCFIRKVGCRHVSHLENRCKILPKTICQICGLVLTQRANVNHKQQHKWKEDLSLVDFTFYDLLTNKCIDPPFPHFPKCKKCDIHFDNVSVAMQHKCGETTNVICESCDRKFTEETYNLHMFYHAYRNQKKKRLKVYKQRSIIKKVLKNGKEITIRELNQPFTLENEVNNTENEIKRPIKFRKRSKAALAKHVMYKCVRCELVVDKSKAFQHKDVKYDCSTIADKYKTCLLCNFLILAKDVLTHSDKHEADPTFVKDNIKLIDFNDGDENDLGLSGESVSESGDSDEERNTYRLYQCIHCKNCFPNKNDVKTHVCSFNAKQCLYCKLLFPWHRIKDHVDEHEKVVDMTRKNMQLILFDPKQEDKFKITTRHVERKIIVSESDTENSGNESDFEMNLEPSVDIMEVDENVNSTTIATSACTETSSFSENHNMKEAHLKDTNGTSLDETKVCVAKKDTELKYKLFQCKTCHMNFCNKDSSKSHECSVKEAWNECNVCGYLFNDSEHSIHIQYHNFDSEMLRDSIVIEYFEVHYRKTDLNIEKSHDSDDVQIIEEDKDTKIQVSNEDMDLEPSNVKVNPLHESVLKSDDDIIHDTSISNKTSDISNICDTELKSENIKPTNSISNNLTDKLNTLDTIETQTETLGVSVSNKIDADCTESDNNESNITKEKESPDEFNSESDETTSIETKLTDIQSNTNKTTVTIYKCECSLSLLDLNTASKHKFDCKTSRISKQNCSKCDLIFTPADLFTHIISHHGNKREGLRFEILNLADIERVKDFIYKCACCELFFVSKLLLFRHYKNCASGSSQHNVCSSCSLGFHKSSFLTHRSKHHGNGVDMKADDFDIKIIEKKDIPKSYYRCKN